MKKSVRKTVRNSSLNLNANEKEILLAILADELDDLTDYLKNKQTGVRGVKMYREKVLAVYGKIKAVEV